MQLTWYGTASLLLQEKDMSIAFDPFDGLPIHGPRHGQPLPHEEDFRRASRIFVTHGHLDHIYHIPRIYGDTDATVYCTEAPKNTLVNHGFPSNRICRIAPGWKESFGPFQITAYQGRHCVFDFPLILRTASRANFWRHPAHLTRLAALDCLYPEKGEILFYEVTCGGTRVQIMGSMNLDSNTEYPTGADVLVLPLQGRSDQDTYALGIIERLQPKSVLLDHYDDSFPPLSDNIDTSGFVRNVWEHFRIRCCPLTKSCPVTIRPAVKWGQQTTERMFPYPENTGKYKKGVTTT